MFTSYSICARPRPRPRPRSRACSRACPRSRSRACPRHRPRLRPRLLPGPASRPSPVPDLPGDGNGRRCRPGVRRGTVGRRIVAEMFPGRAARHPWATETGLSVPRACGNAPLGDGNGSKCSPGVRRGTLGRRKRAEMFPERAARPPWAMELGGSVPRVCGVVLLGDGTGSKCSPSVKCGQLGRRKAAKPSPGRVWKRSRVAAFI